MKYRYTFSLFEIEGFSHDEIAQQLGITASTSRSYLTRAKKMLRQMILIKTTMKELSDDIITKRIKEVLEQYEPDYSPQAWEKIRKQMPVPELWLKTLLLKYKFWLSVLTIAGVLVIVYKVTNILPADKNSAVDPVSSESSNYIASEEA